MINRKQNYLKLKESTVIKNRVLGHIEKNRLIEYDNRIGTNQILNQNERQNLKLKTKA